jgi:hypothetical protein
MKALKSEFAIITAPAMPNDRNCKFPVKIYFLTHDAGI